MLFQPKYSPNVNLIEGYWKLLKETFAKEWTRLGIRNLNNARIRELVKSSIEIIKPVTLRGLERKVFKESLKYLN